MIYRIIDKETSLFLRDDSVWNKENEREITTPCPQGFSKPKWVESEVEIEDLENGTTTQIVGEWVEGNE
jgi:hypothetical protein